MKQTNREHVRHKNDSKFPNRLEHFINQAGLHKGKIAEKIGVTGNTLTQYLKGRYAVPHETRPLLAEAIGVPVEMLFPSLINEPSLPAEKRDIIEEQRLVMTEGDVAAMNPIRRQLLGSILLFPSLDIHLLERLSLPIEPNQSTLAYMEMRTERSWLDRNTLSAKALLPDVVSHLQQAVFLLGLPSSLRERFLSVAGATAMLAGKLLYEMGDFQQARQFYEAAVDAARLVEDITLEAVALGWRSFTWIYEDRPQEARKCIQRARQLAARNANVEVKGWLAAIDAEIQARLGNTLGCLEALKAAAKSDSPGSNSRDSFWLNFDPSLLRGYQGYCYLRLAQQDDKYSGRYLDRSQAIMGEAIESLDGKTKLVRPSLYVDFAQSFALQGDNKQACKYGTECFHILAWRNFGYSQVAISRLLDLKKQLSAQKRTAEIEEFRLLLNALPV